MSAPRIADNEPGRPRPATLASTRGPVSRWSAPLATPLGIMTVVPILVGAVGLFTALVGQRALQESSLDVASQRMDVHAEGVVDTVSQALGQADMLLGRVHALALAHDPQAALEPVAHALADLIRGRPGVSYASVSFPDGTFQGSYIDEDGVLRFQVSRVTPEGPTRVIRYHLVSDGTLTVQREETTSYDPRTRPFYALAVKEGAPAWTEPYPFFGNYRTGITRVAPVFKEVNGARTLHAVVTVDFDVRELSSQLDQHRFEGTRALLFAQNGDILAYAADPGTTQVPSAKDRVLRYPDLKDPVIDALFARLASDDGAGRHYSLSVGDETSMVAIAPIAPELKLAWYVGYVAPENLFLGGFYAYRKVSAVVAALGLIVAVFVAWLFARAITRARKETEKARAAAAEARKEVMELGSYRLVSRLGKGAMGEVWRAEHRLLAREAAIKLINPALKDKDSAEIRARFRREAETIAALRSRNTIELFDYGVAADGTFFFVMELLEGMDLDVLVERHGALPVERAVALLLQAAGSLAEAHDRGLVHRDIKPANIYICRAADEVDVVKVLDFGLVRTDEVLVGVALTDTARTPSVPSTAELSAEDTPLPSGKLTNAGGLMGTPAFMPPEQAMGAPLDGRADLYALACVAVWLLSGKQVYEDDNPMRLLVAHMAEPVPDLRAKLPASVPDALVTLLLRCLQKAPAHRPESVRAFATELRALKLSAAWTDERAHEWWSAHFVPGDEANVEASAPTMLSIGPN